MEIVRKDRESLDALGSEFAAEAISRAIETKGRAVLGLVGGRSVGGLYARLRQHRLRWDQVDFFVADERVVPVTSAASNWRLICADLIDDLLERGSTPPENGHAFVMDDAAPDHGLSTYVDAFAAAGGAFDVVVLSAGEDGHCASLFPHHPSVLDDSPSFILVHDAPKPPPLRISASRTLLERTPRGLIYFLGEAKRDALDLFLDGTKTVIECPSKVVESMGESLVLTNLSS